MKELFDTKQQQIKEIFASLTTPEAKYEKIIQLGRNLPDLDSSLKIEKNLVQGCQSQMYLITKLQENKISFTAFSDALISSWSLFSLKPDSIQWFKKPLLKNETGYSSFNP